MRRLPSLFAVTAVVAALHACDGPTQTVCGCPPVPSLAGRWVGSTPARDSLDVTFTHTADVLTFAGSGTYFPPPISSISARPVSVVGHLDRGTYDLSRITIAGWFAQPVEWRPHGAERPTGYTGTVRLPPGTRDGDTLTLVLRRVLP